MRRNALQEKKLSPESLAEVALVVRPSTLLRWYRKLIAAKFDGSKARQAPGRPRISKEHERLILEVASRNPRWGAKRIQGALHHIGIFLSHQTIHNVLARIRGKGHGLRYQCIESQVAEAVMLRLLDRGIVCLSVHDSFLVAEESAEELKQAMEACYTEIVRIPPVIKPPEIAQSDFLPALLPSGEPDLHYLSCLHASSTAYRFLAGFASKQGQAHI